MHDFTLTLGAYAGDPLAAVALRDAMSRNRVWGDANWSREESAVDLPELDLIREVVYESVSIDTDGELSVLSVFVRTALDTDALVRIGKNFVVMTAWGASREAVGATVRAFQSEFPAVDGELDTSVARGVYL